MARVDLGRLRGASDLRHCFFESRLRAAAASSSWTLSTRTDTTACLLTRGWLTCLACLPAWRALSSPFPPRYPWWRWTRVMMPFSSTRGDKCTREDGFFTALFPPLPLFATRGSPLWALILCCDLALLLQVHSSEIYPRSCVELDDSMIIFWLANLNF